jgi:hypothetical protein
LREFNVDNRAKTPAVSHGDLFPWLAAIAVAIVSVGCGAYLAKRNGRLPQYGPPVPAAGPAPPPQIDSPVLPARSGGKMAVVEKIRADELEDAPLPAKTPEQKRADDAAAREGRILNALSSLPRGLPSSLWGMDLDELAAAVASAERSSSPDGEPIVRINARWYFGDERNPGTFMQAYKGPRT